MKNLICILAAAALCATTACNSVDKELVAKMQGDATEMEGLSGQIDELGKNIANVATLINSAPDAVKTGDNAEFAELMRMSASMTQKHQAVQAEYSDLLGKLKTLATDYGAGKIKTEDAQKEYETLKMGLQGLPDLMGRMNSLNEQMQTQYAKMSADWNAKAEETK